jgi:hypothetical protein
MNFSPAKKNTPVMSIPIRPYSVLMTKRTVDEGNAKNPTTPAIFLFFITHDRFARITMLI